MVSWSAYPRLWGKSGALGRGGMAWPGSKVHLLRTWFAAAGNLPRSSTHTSSHRAWGGGGVVRPTKMASPLGVLSRQENCACGAMARRLVLVKCSPTIPVKVPCARAILRACSRLSVQVGCREQLSEATRAGHQSAPMPALPATLHSHNTIKYRISLDPNLLDLSRSFSLSYAQR
eukprot:COSAG06_NODE_724_length_12795_cov_16.058129_13_plen_175_part_00